MVCKGVEVECCSEGRVGCDDCVAGCREVGGDVELSLTEVKEEGKYGVFVISFEWAERVDWARGRLE